MTGVRPTHEDAGVRPPQQERSRQTMERILRSTRELLEQKSFDDLTVDEIVERADSSKGAFYNRFPDKQSLFRTLNETYFEEVWVHWSRYLDPRRWEGRDLQAFVRDFVTRIVDIYRRHTGLMRALTVHARLSGDPEVRALGSRLNRHVQLLVADLFRLWEDEIEHPDPAIAARFGLASVAAVARGRILYGEEELDGLALEDDALIAELSRLYLGYLRASETCLT